MKNEKIIRSPMCETTINRAWFSNQDIIVFPMDAPLPDNFAKVVRFLFGEGAYVKQDAVNRPSCLIIKGGSFLLSGAKTINADWSCTEI